MQPKTTSEISARQKKIFLFFLLVYALGFLCLHLIGARINEDGFLFLAFLAPALLLGAVAGITWIFYRGPEAH